MCALSIEGFGISASCPGTVATNTTTMIQGSVQYKLVNTGNEDEFVNKVTEALADTTANKQMIQNASQLVKKDYLNTIIAGKFLEVYKSIKA
jgi:glycosyltransferase involved in cell wall biosynthesis